MTSTNTRPEVGDEVTFMGASRGRNRGMQTGVVIGLHLRERRGRRRELAMMFGGETAREMLRVQVGTTIWTICPSLCRVVRKAAVDPVQASRSGHQRINEIRNHNNQVKAQKASAGLQAAEQNGLLDCRSGDKVWVDLRDTYGIVKTAATFVQIMASGRVKLRLEHNGRVMTSHAKFVKRRE